MEFWSKCADLDADHFHNTLYFTADHFCLMQINLQRCEEDYIYSESTVNIIHMLNVTDHHVLKVIKFFISKLNIMWH